MKIAHISDVHIRNYRYHAEYKQVFEELYKKLEKIKPDIIVNTGDTAHTKLNVSPAYYHMAAKFFARLADIAPYHMILGNHDLNLRNLSKIDAVTPIVKALDHPNIFFHKDTAEVDLGNNFVFNVLSITDPENWKAPTNPDKINIALFHGAVSGVSTSTGYIMTHGDIDLNYLKQYDYCLLGDIHKPNQAMDKKGKIRYAGSLVQQNFGESDDKGFLLWDIKSKDKFTVKHYEIKNPKPFVTIELESNGKLPENLDLPLGSRLRLVSNNTLPLDTIRRSVDIVKSRFKPEAVTYLCRSNGQLSSDEIVEGLVKEDLRDIAVQEELIDEYLQPYQADKDVMRSVFELNRKFNSIVEEEEEVSRNVNWSLKSLKWDNLFNYGEDNYINFEKLSGIVGILGKNYSGKSSIIDSLLYTIYNSTSKNERKNLNVVNQTKDKGAGYVEIDVDNDTYKILRNSDKYERKLKGNTTIEAKTDVEFLKYDKVTKQESLLTGEKRSETDKNIRRIFGTLDDFLFTSMASQNDSLAYLNEGSTKRKEILAKFLDLEIFEKKFKKAKEEASDIRVVLKRMQKRDYESEIIESRTELARIETKLMNRERKCKTLQEEIQTLTEEYDEIGAKISSIPNEIIDIAKVNRLLKDGQDHMTSLGKDNEALEENLKSNEGFLVKLDSFINDFDLEGFEGKKEKIQLYQDQLSELEKEIEVHQIRFNNHEKKIALLSDVPCGSEFSHCKFIKDAYSALDNKSNVEQSLSSLKISKVKRENQIDELNPDAVIDYLDKYKKVLEKRRIVQSSINDDQINLERNKTSLIKSKHKLEELKSKKAEYEENKEAIEDLEGLTKSHKELAAKIQKAESVHESCRAEVLELYKENGHLEQKLNQVKSDKEYFEKMREEYTAYDLFLSCMNTGGISYDIIKKKLPIINEEIAKILTNIVEFQVMFVNDEKKLDILIKHPKFDARPIEMGSGAEKTIAAMAIRLALLNVSTLPKGDIFILDEPGTALDADNMEGFVRLLEMIKSQFKTVLLISHLDALKDVVDQQIMIDKEEDGFAKVKEG